jgi:hypothetical protein
MSDLIFLDTSGLLSLFDTSERSHDLPNIIFRSVKGLTFTANLSKVVYVILILSLAVFLDARLLFQSPYGVGVDGYYYVLQIDSLLNQGSFYFPSPTPIVLYFLSGLAYLLGSSVLALKLGALVLQGLLCLSCLALVISVTRSFWLGLLGMSVMAFSSLHLFFISEFINSLGALVFLSGGCLGLLKFRRTGKKSWLFFALAGIICAGFSHRSTSGLIVLILAALAISPLFLNSTTGRTKIFALPAFVALFALPLILYWQPFFTLPEGFRNEIHGFPESPFRQINLPESLMIILAGSVGLSSLWHTPEGRQSDMSVIFCTILVWSLLTTLNPFLNHQTGFQGITGRLDVLAYVQAAILFPLGMSLLQTKCRISLYPLALCTVILLIWSYLQPLPMGLRKTYVDEREALIRQLIEARQTFCEKPIVIAAHGKQFVATSILGLTSQQTLPAEDSYQCIYWLVKLENQASWEFKLVDDNELRTTMAGLAVDEFDKLLASNPHLKGFQKKNLAVDLTK